MVERASFSFGSGDRDNKGEPIVADPATIFGGGGGDTGGSGGIGDDFDPDIHVSRDKRNADGSYRRKRGRRSGSGTGGTTHRKTKAARTDSVEAISRILCILHSGVAAATKTPELEIDEQEGRMIADPLTTLLDEFDIKPDPKIEAIVGLVTAVCAVYGPRAYTIASRKRAEGKQPRNVTPPQQGNVVYPFTDAPPQPTATQPQGPPTRIMEPTEPVFHDSI